MIVDTFIGLHELDFSSFFSRKDKKKTEAAPAVIEAVKPKSKEQAIAAIHNSPLTEQTFEHTLVKEDIVVTEFESSFAPGIEDAAMLYANGRTDEAVNLLKMFIHRSPEEESLWLMLFDLYQVSRQQQEFEQLAMEYAIKHEKSPPVWVSGDTAKVANNNGKNNKTLVSDGQLFSLKGRLDQHMADRIQLLQEAASKGAIQLDLSGITEITADGCTLLQAALVKLQKQQSRLQIASGALVGLLQQYVANADTSAPEHWLLLLQLYQLQGKQTEFEDLAIAFAIHFELSPPSWEAPAEVVQVVSAAAEPELPADQIESDVFKMCGTITSASGAVFEQFKQFTRHHAEIEIDMSAVDRVEFASVGLFMDALMALIPSGKRVTITGANMMVYVLLIVMGVDQMAPIMPRK
ncbi:MAG: STAS domain-containing protein [Sulfuriferula sp.]|nr:STAS domain-containing protein [Sulfuriferula sp.]